MKTSAKEWYALHVKENCEVDVADSVRAIGDADTLLPIEHRMERTAKGMRERHRVLMPGYVFVGVTMNARVWQALRRVRHVIGVLGEPHCPIPDEQMAHVAALYWHCVNGTKVERRNGVTRVVDGALLNMPHKITCADQRQGVITVQMDLPGGQREVTLHAEFLNTQGNRDGG